MTGPNNRPADGRRAVGQLGEARAVQFLLEADYRIIQRNWRCRSGEIDIIAEYMGELIFVEVRTRTSGGRFGNAVESVDWRKQKQVRSVAEVYLCTIGSMERKIRFDVIALTIGRGTNDVQEIKHITGAF